MPENEEPWSLVIGRVTAPFGIRGAVRVKPETDFPERFRDLEMVCLELPGGEERVFHVTRSRITPKGIILGFEECRDRSQAAELRRSWVKIKPGMAVPLPAGSYWVHQIIGLRVVTEEGEDLGEITEVIRGPANDVYVTPSAMIPALRRIVRGIDLERGRVVVSLPAGHRSAAQESGQ
jgi:16S rRNA processing protein RimM